MPAHRSKAVRLICAVRAKLQQVGAPQVWRSLDEVAGTPEFHDYLHREFPSNASEWLDPVGRRNFLNLMSASMALAGVTACTVQPAGIDRAVRAPAGGRNPRQAAVLRNGDDARRRRLGPARRKPRRPADEDRRQSRSSREPGRDRSVRAGLDPHALRSGPLARRCSARRDSTLERGDRRNPRRAIGQAASKGAGFVSSPKRSPRRRWRRRSSKCWRSIRVRNGSSGSRSIAIMPARARARRSASTSSRSTT